MQAGWDRVLALPLKLPKPPSPRRGIPSRAVKHPRWKDFLHPSNVRVMWGQIPIPVVTDQPKTV